jgi:hypothetical protein
MLFLIAQHVVRLSYVRSLTSCGTGMHNVGSRPWASAYNKQRVNTLLDSVLLGLLHDFCCD